MTKPGNKSNNAAKVNPSRSSKLEKNEAKELPRSSSVTKQWLSATTEMIKGNNNKQRGKNLIKQVKQNKQKGLNAQIESVKNNEKSKSSVPQKGSHSKNNNSLTKNNGVEGILNSSVESENLQSSDLIINAQNKAASKPHIAVTVAMGHPDDTEDLDYVDDIADESNDIFGLMNDQTAENQSDLEIETGSSPQHLKEGAVNAGKISRHYDGEESSDNQNESGNDNSVDLLSSPMEEQLMALPNVSSLVNKLVSAKMANKRPSDPADRNMRAKQPSKFGNDNSANFANRANRLNRPCRLVKSPSDTTLYRPALQRIPQPRSLWKQQLCTKNF